MTKFKINFDSTYLYTMMSELIMLQNIDGSFGDDDKFIHTSYFLIAMVLFNKVRSPYLLTIKRALNFVLYEDEDSAIGYLALKLLSDKSSLKSKEIKSKVLCNENNDSTGNLLYIYKILLVDIEKFSHILFNKSMKRDEFICYLFEEIYNAYM